MLKENSHIKLTKLIEKVFKNRKYEYGKLQELKILLDTQKKGHLYIEQVKKGAIYTHVHVYILIKNGGYSYIYTCISGRAEKGCYLGCTSILYHI